MYNKNKTENSKNQSNEIAKEQSTQLIEIIERDGKQAVSARELYIFLEVKEKFVDWIKRMIDYGFDKNVDYQILSDNSEKIKRGRPARDYALSIDCAKEISMIQRSNKGKEARKYFIAVEKFARFEMQKYITAQSKRIDELTKQVAVINQTLKTLAISILPTPSSYPIQDLSPEDALKVEQYAGMYISEERIKICKLVYHYSEIHDCDLQTAWNAVYKIFSQKMNRSLFSLKKKAGETWLSAIERKGKIHILLDAAEQANSIHSSY